MSNNISIDTAFQRGTGIIYPCECEINNLKNNSTPYLVLVPRHLIEDLSEHIESPEKDYRPFFNFEIYDFKDNLVEQEMIEKVYVFNNNYEANLLEDIACLLLFLNNSVRLNLKTKVHRNEIANREELTLTGYPQVMSGIQYATKLELKCIYKKIVPRSEKLGILHISDDYHWYNDGYKDLSLFKGFSGGTVCYKDSLYGMNQSITNLEDGENPFKLVFFLRIDYIFDYLRDAGCIVYRINRDGSYKIKWVTDPLKKRENQTTAILLGGSGSGKSSFAKSFSSHSQLIDSTNDGQTTRNNIVYQFKVYEEKPRIEITFLNQKEFQKKMKDLNYRTFLKSLLELLFGQLIDDTESNLVQKYIFNLYHFLRKIEEQEILRSGTVDTLMYSSDESVIIEEFDYLLNRLFERIDITQLRFLMRNAQFNQLLENVSLETTKANLKNKIENIWDSSNTPIKTEILEIMHKYLPDIEQENFDFKGFQRECVEFLMVERQVNSFTDFLKNNIELMNKFVVVEGFFDIAEFPFVDDNEILCAELISSVEEITQKEIGPVFEEIYRRIYNFLNPLLLNYMGLNQINDKKTIGLNSQTYEKEKKLISLILQVKNKQSISSLVKSVMIYDSISSQYSYLFDKLDIDTFKLIDTYGLDHANWDLSVKSTLKKIVYQFNEEGLIKFDNNVSVFYLKKLDSGRPNELKSIIPIIHGFIPQAAIYTIFTGADIFYQNEFDKLIDLDWKTTTNSIPKNIDYLISKKGREEILGKINSNSQRKENLYVTMINNLVVYTSNEKIVSRNYDAYESNFKQIYNLVNSMTAKEYSSLGIIPKEILVNLRKNEIKEEIQNILHQIFKDASITNWEKYHYMTRLANSRRLLNEKVSEDISYNTLGFQGAYNHYWYQLFHESYTKTMIGSNIRKLLELLELRSGIQTNAVASALVSMEQEFLGSPDSLKQKNTREKSEFRTLLEEMYNEEEKALLFNTTEPTLQVEERNRDELLNQYFNFGKKFTQCLTEASSPINNIVDYFINVLESQIIQDNLMKSKNIMNINYDFLESLDSMKRKYIQKYKLTEMNEDSIIEEFYSLVRYFIDTK